MENDNNNAMLTTKNLLMINHNCPNREKRLIERQVLLLSSYCSNLLVPDLDAELADSNSLELMSNQCIPHHSWIRVWSESVTSPQRDLLHSRFIKVYPHEDNAMLCAMLGCPKLSHIYSFCFLAPL